MGERLDLRQLADVVRDWAEQPTRWEALLRCLDTERWSGLLHRDDSFDVWLLTWPVQTGTQLHDHGPSAGAFEVIAGTLEEIYVRRRVRRRRLNAGARVAFPAGAIHDVRNPGGAPGHTGAGSHAISLHAYSPPLSSMTYFEQQGGHLSSIGCEPVVVPALLTAPATGQLVGIGR